MALVNCPECGKEISDKAKSCPNCAYPIQAVTVEATAKKWKGIKLTGGILVPVGLVIVFATKDNPTIGGLVFGGLLTLFGLILYVVGGVGKWWHHE